MTEFIEWLKGLDYTALYLMAGAFLTTWGGSIVALVVGLLKTRTKNFNYQVALDKVNIKLSQEQNEKIEALRNDIVKLLTDVQKNIIKNNDEQSAKRLEVINQIVADANESLEEIKQITADDTLKGLN